MNGLTSNRWSNDGWSMAQRRGAARYRTQWLVAGLVMTVLLVGSIQLGNSVTSLRREIQDLVRTCQNLEAQRALLAVRWNTESSRQVVMRRAQRELGLVSDTAPGAILVSTGDPAGQNLTWPRLLQSLGQGDLTPAALAAPDGR